MITIEKQVPSGFQEFDNSGYFANVVGAKQIGIYEAQFIPPHWFESGKYPFPYKRNNCNPSLPGNKTYKYCDPTWNNTKGNWCKFKTMT